MAFFLLFGAADFCFQLCNLKKAPWAPASKIPAQVTSVHVDIARGLAFQR